MTRRSFWVHTDDGGIGTTIRIFNELIRQTSEVRGTSLKIEYRGQSRGYDSPKSVRIKGRTQGFLGYAKSVKL